MSAIDDVLGQHRLMVWNKQVVYSDYTVFAICGKAGYL